MPIHINRSDMMFFVAVAHSASVTSHSSASTRSTAQHMRPRAAQVGEEVGVGATGVLQGVGEREILQPMSSSGSFRSALRAGGWEPTLDLLERLGCALANRLVAVFQRLF